MANELKMPIDVSRDFLTFIRYRYGDDPKLLFELKGKKTKPSIEKGIIYWVPENYRLIKADDKKLIQFQADGYKNEEPAWINASKMRKSYARYHFECTKVEERKLNKLGKKEVLSNGTPPERIILKEENGLEKGGKFATKPFEIWRFARWWDKISPEGSKWADNPEIYMYHVIVHRVEPEHTDFYTRHWSENVKK